MTTISPTRGRTWRDLRVDGERLLGDIAGLARYGRDDRGGVSRTGFSAADNAARVHLVRTATDAGLDAEVDPAGNVLFRRRGLRDPGPSLLMGSHLDSVPHGGHLDGAYGVVAALEVLRTLNDRRVPMPVEPVAVAWANEEGSLFPRLFFGPRARTGSLAAPGEITDTAGRPLREPLLAAGGDLDRIGDAVWADGAIDSYLELHIEQGPVLERAGLPIGVVDAIVGRTMFDITVHGRAGHAGTTPMELRADALTAAARLVLAIEQLAGQDGVCRVATVGCAEIEPNVGNVIRASVRRRAEGREGDADRLRAAERAVLAAAARVQTVAGVVIEVVPGERTSPVPTDPALRRVIAAASERIGAPYEMLSSGAGHDAQIVADVAPVGMIFVPSRDGVSHTPAEATDDADLVTGANVLLHAALCIAAAD